MLRSAKQFLRNATALAAVAFALSGCSHPTVIAPAPSDVKSAPALGAAEDERLSKIAANVEAGRQINAHNADGPVKSALEGTLAVAASYLPTPRKPDLTTALTWANLALSGQLDAAQAGWDKSRGEASVLQDRITTLEKTVRDERAAAAADLTAKLKAAHDEERAKAEADQRKLIGWIFYGGGALLLAAAGIIMAFAGEVPQFGPRAALGVAASGGLLIGAGISINMLLSHPWVIWTILGTAAATLAAGLAFMWSNHAHHVDNVPSPVPSSS